MRTKRFVLPLRPGVRDWLIESLAGELADMMSCESYNDHFDRAVNGDHVVGLNDLTDAELVDEWRQVNESDELKVEVVLRKGADPRLLQEQSGLVLQPSAVVDLVATMLRVRRGETLTEEVILERARNLAQALAGVYVSRP